MRILLAEDDASIAEGICASLRHGGHAVDHAARGNLADTALRDHDYDLLVLDLGLPSLDGSEVLRRLRRRGSRRPQAQERGQAIDRYAMWNALHGCPSFGRLRGPI